MSTKSYQISRTHSSRPKTVLGQFLRKNRRLYAAYLRHAKIRPGKFQEALLRQALYVLLADPKHFGKDPCILIAGAGVAMKVTTFKRTLLQSKPRLSATVREEELSETYTRAIDCSVRWVLTQEKPRSIWEVIMGIDPRTLYAGHINQAHACLREVTEYYCHGTH